jgi:hypothetical protein
VRTIITTEDTNLLLQEPQGIVLAYFNWSKQGRRSLRTFKTWERTWRAKHPTSRVGFYCFDHARFPGLGGLYFGLIRGKSGMKGGFGAVAWTRYGIDIARITNAGRSGPRTLTRITAKHFEMGDAPLPPHPFKRPRTEV